MKLYTKILLWFFLNLLMLGAALYAVFRSQFGLESFFLGQAGDRIQAVSEVITVELSGTPESGWNEVLKRFSQAYRVQFVLFRSDGSQGAGDPLELPSEVLAKVTERRGPFGGLGRGPPPGRGPSRPAAITTTEPGPKFMLHTGNPSRYWVGICLGMPDGERRGSRLTLLALSHSLHGGGLFVDLTPFVVVGMAALVFSVLFWLPLVRGITRSISQMTQATERIAEGRFDARVPSRRRDELGRLSQAINRMAARLAGFVTGQKRFLGDIAHELCSPISRIQVALGILEQRADEKQKAYVDDVREDVQHMSNLVSELLSISKAGLQGTEPRLEAVALAALVRREVDREGSDPDAIGVQIAEDLQVLADPDLLSRAVANLIRNALVHAGNAGPIAISAARRDQQVVLTIADSGPGVPEENLQHIFDPFFRLEPSRSRETGGVGLGLAIVKTCIEACQGTVSARNRQPAGLQVDIVLKASPTA